MVKDAIQPHLQPLLDKQVILEETVSQLQNNNANLKAKIDLIDMRLEEQEQYSRRISLRFDNVRVPTDQKGNIIQPVDTDGTDS
jgi:predicted  nucleic acid-binding Zn-ribbon protein